MLTDDKTYPYIKITNEKYPRLITTRKVKKDKAKYFGPYPNAFAASETKKLLDRIYPLRKCVQLPKEVCLYYHLGQCLAPCVKDIEKQVYELWSTSKEIRVPSDVKGLKLRTPGGVANEIYKSLGAVPVSVSHSETYEALEKGVIEAASYSSVAVDASGTKDLLKTSMFIHLGTAIHGIAINVEYLFVNLLGLVHLIFILEVHGRGIEGIGILMVELDGRVEVFEGERVLVRSIENAEFFKSGTVFGVEVAHLAQQGDGIHRVASLFVNETLHKERCAVAGVFGSYFAEVLHGTVVVATVVGNLTQF